MNPMRNVALGFWHLQQAEDNAEPDGPADPALDIQGHAADMSQHRRQTIKR